MPIPGETPNQNEKVAENNNAGQQAVDALKANKNPEAVDNAVKTNANLNKAKALLEAQTAPIVVDNAAKNNQSLNRGKEVVKSEESKNKVVADENLRLHKLKKRDEETKKVLDNKENVLKNIHPLNKNEVRGSLNDKVENEPGQVKSLNKSQIANLNAFMVSFRDKDHPTPIVINGGATHTTFSESWGINDKKACINKINSITVKLGNDPKYAANLKILNEGFNNNTIKEDDYK